jgi:hypothetical protein
MDRDEAIERETAKIGKGSIDVDDLVRFIDRMSTPNEQETGRCAARRSNDEQCTRRCKAGMQFCGTHSKGAPKAALEAGVTSREVVAIEIDGIMHYADDRFIYKTEDVLRNVVNPVVVARYTKVNGKYIVEW